jgi:hypothetical protein
MPRTSLSAYSRRAPFIAMLHGSHKGGLKAKIHGFFRMLASGDGKAELLGHCHGNGSILRHRKTWWIEPEERDRADASVPNRVRLFQQSAFDITSYNLINKADPFLLPHICDASIGREHLRQRRGCGCFK